MDTSSNAVSNIISTGDCLERRTITWKIDNFAVIRSSEELIRSQRITIHLGTDVGFPTEWNCFLAVTEPPNDEQLPTLSKNIGLYLSLKMTPEGTKDVTLFFQVRVNNCNHYFIPIIRTFMVDGKITTPGCGWVNVLTPEIMSENILDDGSLYLDLELKLFSSCHKPMRMNMAAKEKEYNQKFTQKLRQDMTRLLSMPTANGNAETKIISKDGVEFNVIRGILSVRSPVFETMFHADMEEARTGIVRITDLSSATISVLLHFLYTGELHSDWKISSVLPELIYAAGKYQLPELLAYMDDFAGRVCSKENAGRIIFQARRLGLKTAEKQLVEFMIKNIGTLEDIVSFAEDSTVSNYV